MTTGLLHAPGQLAASMTPATATKYRLFFDITSGSPIPTIIDSSGALYSFGGLTREQIEDLLGLDLTTTATILPTYTDNGAGTGTYAWDVRDGSLANVKLANMADQRIKGNVSGGSAAPTDLTAAQVSTMLSLGSLATLSFIDNAHLASMATMTAKANITGGSATPTDITPTQLTANLVNDATLTTGTNLPGRMTAIEKTRINNTRDLVADYGADALGSVDCTTVFNTALAAGGTLTLPIGVFKVNTTGASLNAATDGMNVTGLSQRNTIVQPNHASADVFNVTGDGVVFDNFRVQPPASGTRNAASGYAFNLAAGADVTGIRNMDIIWMWSGVKSSASTGSGAAMQFIEKCNIREVSQNIAGGAAIYVEGTADRYINRITSDNGTNATNGAAIRVVQCGSIVVSECNLIHSNNAMELTPGAGLTIASVNAVNNFFDTSVNGLVVNGIGTGTIGRSKFTHCWFGTHSANGALLNGVAAGTATFNGLGFSHCEFFQNTTAGINCPIGGGIWGADFCKFAQNGTAVNLTGGSTHYATISNCYLGAYGVFTTNTTGMAIATGTYVGIIVTNNSFVANTTNLTLGTVTVAVWSQFRITDNPGINPRGAVTTPAVPATGVAVTNTTGFRVLIAWKATATINTALTVNGVNLAPNLPPINTFATFVLDPGGTISWTGGTAPTWTWVGN